MKKTFFLLILLCGNAFGGTINPKVPDQKYLEYGAKHQCVVKLEGTQNDDKSFFASAVLVEPKILLTAAHVAKDVKYAKVVNGEDKHKVLFFVIPEDYDESKFGGNGFDICLGFLEKEISVDFYPQLYDKEDELDKICSLAGFGITGNFIDGATVSDGKKRAGSNIIEQIENDILICSLQNKKTTSLEFLISNGDSGGGLFVDKKLAGIHSSIYVNNKRGKLNSDRSNFSAHTRISKHKNWINQVIEEIKRHESNFGRATGDDGK
jgi:hypothetical protein